MTVYQAIALMSLVTTVVTGLIVFADIDVGWLFVVAVVGATASAVGLFFNRFLGK